MYPHEGTILQVHFMIKLHDSSELSTLITYRGYLAILRKFRGNSLDHFEEKMYANMCPSPKMT